MPTKKDFENTDLLKTHSLYPIPEGKLIPIVVTQHMHPVTAAMLDKPIFGIYIHREIVKTLKTFLNSFGQFEKDGCDYESWQLTGDIYLPKAE